MNDHIERSRKLNEASKQPRAPKDQLVKKAQEEYKNAVNFKN